MFFPAISLVSHPAFSNQAHKSLSFSFRNPTTKSPPHCFLNVVSDAKRPPSSQGFRQATIPLHLIKCTPRKTVYPSPLLFSICNPPTRSSVQHILFQPHLFHLHKSMLDKIKDPTDHRQQGFICCCKVKFPIRFSPVALSRQHSPFITLPYFSTTHMSTQAFPQKTFLAPHNSQTTRSSSPNIPIRRPKQSVAFPNNNPIITSSHSLQFLTQYSIMSEPLLPFGSTIRSLVPCLSHVPRSFVPCPRQSRLICPMFCLMCPAFCLMCLTFCPCLSHLFVFSTLRFTVSVPFLHYRPHVQLLPGSHLCPSLFCSSVQKGRGNDFLSSCLSYVSAALSHVPSDFVLRVLCFGFACLMFFCSCPIFAVPTHSCPSLCCPSVQKWRSRSILSILLARPSSIPFMSFSVHITI